MFYNEDPEFAPDYDYWINNMTGWSHLNGFGYAEALPLIMNVNPRLEIKRGHALIDIGFNESFCLLQERLERALKVGAITHTSEIIGKPGSVFDNFKEYIILPRDLIAWAKAQGLRIPEPFLALLDDRPATPDHAPAPTGFDAVEFVRNTLFQCDPDENTSIVITTPNKKKAIRTKTAMGFGRADKAWLALIEIIIQGRRKTTTDKERILLTRNVQKKLSTFFEKEFFIKLPSDFEFFTNADIRTYKPSFSTDDDVRNKELRLEMERTKTPAQTITRGLKQLPSKN